MVKIIPLSLTFVFGACCSSGERKQVVKIIRLPLMLVIHVHRLSLMFVVSVVKETTGMNTCWSPLRPQKQTKLASCSSVSSLWLFRLLFRFEFAQDATFPSVSSLGSRLPLGRGSRSPRRPADHQSPWSCACPFPLSSLLLSSPLLSFLLEGKKEKESVRSNNPCFLSLLS